MPLTCTIPRLDKSWNETSYQKGTGCPGTTIGTDSGTVSVLTNGSGKEVLVNQQLPAGWRVKKARGELLPFTHYSVRKCSAEASGGAHAGNCYSLGGSTKVRTGHHCGFYSVLLPSPPPMTTPTAHHLLQSAWADAKSDAIDLLTELAEAPETFDLFKSHAEAFHRRFDRIRKASAKKSKRGGKTIRRPTADDISSTWMESRYGWRPLIGTANDIKDIWDEWRKPDQPFILRRYRRSETLSASDGPDADISHSITGTSGQIGLGAWNNVHVLVRALVTTQVRRASIHHAVTINPLATAWELVPLSFVVDWFLNTNDLFRAHWPSAAIHASAACTSVKETHTVNLGFGPNYSSDDGPIFSDCWFKYIEQSYTRTPHESIPLSLKYRPNLNIAKMLDLSIILKQKMRRYGIRW